MSEISHVPSPYEGKRLRLGTHLAISSYWFGSNVLWTALLAVMLTPQMKILGGPRAAEFQGTVMGIGAIFALVVPLLVGPISDRTTSPLGRRRPFLIVGNIVCVSGLAVMYLGARAISFAEFLIGFMLVQLGNNIATGAYSGLIPDLVPEDQRGKASGYMGLMTQLGSAVGAVGSLILMGSGQVAASYAFLAIALILTACGTILGIKENPLRTKPASFNVGAYFRSLWISPREYPDFFWVWITRALVMLGFYIVQPNLQFYLGDVIHVKNPPEAAGKTILIVLVAATITGLWGGHLSDKVGRKKIVYVANALMALMAICFPFATTMEGATFIAVIFGFGYGAYISVDWALGTDVLPDKHNVAKDMAVWHVSMTLPQSIAAPAAGFLLAAFGYSTAIVEGETVYHYSRSGYFAIFALAAIFLSSGAVLLRNVKGAR